MARTKRPVVRVLIDVPATSAARQRYAWGSSMIVGRFLDPIALTRIIDAAELARLQRGEDVVGGHYAVEAERAYGASWASCAPEKVVAWARKHRDRLGKELYIVQTEGQGRTFAHLGPKGLRDLAEQVSLPADFCDTGLGCSVRVPAADVQVYRVEVDRSLSPVSLTKPVEYHGRYRH